MELKARCKIVREFLSGIGGASASAVLWIIVGGVAGAGLSGAAAITATLAALGLGFGMLGGLVVLALTGIGSSMLVRPLAEHFIEKYCPKD